MYKVSVTVELYHPRLDETHVFEINDPRQADILRSQGWEPSEPTPALARLWGHLVVEREPVMVAGWPTHAAHLRLR